MKAVLLGSGWRAQFYHRISYALPELLTISAVCTHDRERALALRKAGINAFSQIEEALAADHDTVIAAGSPALFAERMHFLMDRGESVISETSFLSLSDEENSAFLTMKGAVAEQYPFTPLYASVIASLPLIGKVSQLSVSGLHNHHAAAIARLILDLDDGQLHLNQNAGDIRLVLFLRVKDGGGRLSSVHNLRNAYGEIYESCSKCNGNASSGTVYYTERGDCYHSDAGCSGLKRTVRLVKKSETEGKAMCTRCRQREE